MSQADELLKYKQLLDAGAITQEEFDSAKAKLLGTAANRNNSATQTAEHNTETATSTAAETEAATKPASFIDKVNSFKHWGAASIILALLSMGKFLFLIPVAMACAIVGLFFNKKKAGAIFGLVLSAFMFIACMGNSDKETNTDATTEVATESVADAADENDEDDSTESEDSVAESSETTEGTTEITEDTTTEESELSDEEKVAAFKERLTTALDGSYGSDSYNIEVCSAEGLMVWIWDSRLETVATAALTGDSQAIDSWKGVRSSCDDIVTTVYDAYKEYGFKTGEADVIFLFATDSSLENVLLGYSSGECIMDQVALSLQ